MSYDLYLYKKKGNKLTNSDVKIEFKKMIPKNISEIDSQINYENERTGVYFLMDFNEPNTEQEDLDVFDSFNDFENTNISISINFLRPDYFGKEIFPLICKCVEKLDLYILNAQEFDDLRHRPLKWTKEELIKHWTLHNKKVSKQNFIELQLKFLNKDKSDYLWDYTSKIVSLENMIKEDIYIPNAFVIQNQDSNELFTYIVWAESIPLILPKVDFVILVKKHKKLFKTVEEIGIVKYQSILDKFESDFEVFDYNDGFLILNQKNADRIKKDFNAFPIWKPLKGFGPQIGLDGFVNNKV